jgi:hypothetical protein
LPFSREVRLLTITALRASRRAPAGADQRCAIPPPGWGGVTNRRRGRRAAAGVCAGSSSNNALPARERTVEARRAWPGSVAAQQGTLLDLSRQHRRRPG